MKKKNNLDSVTHDQWIKFFQRDITGEEKENILTKYSQQKYIYTESLEVICKHFLTYVLNKNAFDLKFKEIRKLCLSIINDEEILEDFPKNENEFYRYIAEKNLWLVDAPRNKIMSLYIEASEDLKIIQDNLEKIDKQIHNIKNHNSRGENFISSEYKYEIDRLEYYKDKNIKAKNTIFRFLANDIKSFAYNECHWLNKVIYSLFRSSPYSFSRRNFFFARRTRESYDPDSFSILKNKFLRLGIKEYDKVTAKHQNGELSNEGLLELSKNYIEKYSLIADLPIFIKRNHLLNKRSEILNKIIFHFNNNDYISLCYMIPPQIEGIFTDFCLEIGIQEKDVHKCSITNKIEKITAKSNLNIPYDYFACYFPAVRNKLLHGVIIKDELEYHAIMLMLDLISVCDMAFSEEFDFNKSIRLISDIYQHRLPEDLYLWIDYIDLELPKIYQIEDKVAEIVKLYETDEFWDYIESILYGDDLNIIEERVSVLYYKKIGSEQCKKYLKIINQKKNEK